MTKLRTALVAMVLWPLSALPQNLISNANFDGGSTNAWPFFPGFSNGTVQWSSLDADSRPGSGSLLLSNQNTSASRDTALYQCLAIEPSRLYLLSGKVRIPAHLLETGRAQVLLDLYSSSDCTTGGVAGFSLPGAQNVFDTWAAPAISLTSPSTAHSAIVFLDVFKNEPGGLFQAQFDDLFLAASAPKTLTVPASASIHGAGGAFFHSDLWVTNRSTAFATTVQARYRCFAGQSCGTDTKSFVLGPRTSTLYSDVVGGLFGSPGTAGAIELTYDSAYGEVTAASRVYTPDLPSPTNGTAVPAYAAGQARTRAMFLGLGSNGGDLSSGFRSNAGAYNPNGASVDLTFTLYSSSGAMLGTPLTRTWGANEALQISDIFGAVGAGATATTNAYLVVTSTSSVFPYVTVIDNQSGDSVWVNPTDDGTAAASQGPNLLSNPTMDGATTGWTAVSATATYSPLDATGKAGSGSLLLTNANTNANTVGVAYQCVAVDAARPYSFGMKARTPSGQAQTGTSYLYLFWLATGNCTGSSLGFSVSSVSSNVKDAWSSLDGSATSPAGTASAQVYLALVKTEAGGSFQQNFDDVWLAQGSPATLTVPAVASIHGNGGAFFHSDMWVMNRSDVYTQTVTATYRCFTGQSCSGGTKTFSLGPRQSLEVQDVAGAGLFKAPETAGAVELTYDTTLGMLAAGSRVYTPSLPSPTNGAAVPALASSEARTRTLFTGLGSNGGDLSSGFRSNAGAYNPSASSVAVTFTLHDGATSGVLGTPLTRTWGPNEAYQISDIFSAVGAGSKVTTSAYLVVTSASPVFPYVTVIDNQSGDSVWVNPSSDE
jgi:hypothetical protein